MREYVVVYERAASNYSAYAPDLPGCVAAAETIEETEALMKEAIRLYLETLLEEGEQIPEPQTYARTIQVA
jgi:predicted RNase H-like HicB family nuclease